MDELFLMFLFALLMLTLVLGPVSFIMILVINSRNKKRVSKLEERTQAIERRMWEQYRAKQAAGTEDTQAPAGAEKVVTATEPGPPEETSAAEDKASPASVDSKKEGSPGDKETQAPKIAAASSEEQAAQPTPVSPDPDQGLWVKQGAVPRSSSSPPSRAVVKPKLEAPRYKSPEPKEAPMSEQKIMVLLLGIVGGIAFLAAGLFFLKYSIDQGWLGPQARVLLGSLAGVALLVVGEVMRKKHATLSHALAGTGIGLIYTAMWAGERLYDIIPLNMALTVVAAVVGLAGVQAVRFGSRLVAYLGLVGAYALLLLMGADSDFGQWGLLYVLALALGTGEVVRRTRWADLLIVSLFGSLALELASFSEAYRDPWVWAVLVGLIHLSLMARVRLWKDSHQAPASALGAAMALSAAVFTVGYVLMEKTILALPIAGLLVILILALRFMVPDKDGVVHGLSLMAAAVATTIFLTASLLDDQLYSFSAALALSTVCLGVVLVSGLSGVLSRTDRTTPGVIAMGLSAAVSWVLLCTIHYHLYQQHIGDIGLALVPLIHGIMALVPLFKIKSVWGPMEPPLKAEQKVFLIQAALVLLFLTAVLPIQLEHEHLAASLALEAVVLFAMASRWRSGELTVVSLVCLAWSLIQLLGDTNQWVRPMEGEMAVGNWRLYAFAVPIAATLLITRLLRKKSNWLGGISERERGPVRGLTGIAGLIMTFIYLNLESMAWFKTGGIIGTEVHRALPEMVRSFVWLGFGFLLLVWGITRFNKPVRFSALFILVLTVGKVFLLDVSTLSDLYRVFALVALGVVLFLGAFLYSRVVASWDSRNEQDQSFD